MRRVLSIDGGGIKGVFPAAFLASLESCLQNRVTDYFDLIVGTSTGGIIALGLGMGMAAKEVLGFYETYGPSIFSGNPKLAWFRHWRRAKYSPEPLRVALSGVFGDRRLGDSRKRLVIPSLNIDTGEVHVWKTSHHPHLELDYKHSAVEVALSTAAAPTYFPTYQSETGVPLIDGGVWANNPIAVALVECIGVLGWVRDDIRVLSLGCTTTPLTVNWGRTHSLGKFGWASKIIDVFVAAQSSSAFGMAQHLIGDRQNIVRISPAVGPRYNLDKVSEIPSLRGLGETEARKALPELQRKFFVSPLAEEFTPFHS
jgi:hypothetical protein